MALQPINYNRNIPAEPENQQIAPVQENGGLMVPNALDMMRQISENEELTQASLARAENNIDEQNALQYVDEVNQRIMARIAQNEELDDADLDALFEGFDDAIEEVFGARGEPDVLPQDFVERESVYTPPVQRVNPEIDYLDNNEVANNLPRLGQNQQNMIPLEPEPEQGQGQHIAVAFDGHINWTPISRLGGYVGMANVRTLGTAIFSKFPCYQDMVRECRAQNRDPLGEVQCLANFGGMGPNRPQEINAIARWIRENARPIDRTTLEFNAMPGYRPNILLATTENDSFLLVEETIAGGAPANANYVYSWRGGSRHYNADANIGLERLYQDEGGIRAVRQEQPAQQQLQIAQAPQQQAIIAPVAREVVNKDVPRPQENRRPNIQEVNEEKIVDKPVRNEIKAPVVGIKKEPLNAMQALRQDGFSPFGTESGPVLKKTLDNGYQVIVDGNGKSITLSKTFGIMVSNDRGDIVLERTILDSVEGVFGQIEEFNQHRNLKI